LRRRQQEVMPDPQLISWGGISQGMPLLRTNRMPLRAARSSMRGLPPLGLGGSSGKRGSITSQSSSGTSSLAMLSPYPLPGFVRRIKYVMPNALAEFEANSTYETIFRAVERYVPKGARVLDVGCGRGELMQMLSGTGYEMYGCDMDDECVKMGRQYGKVQKMAVEDISPNRFDERFDCVIMSHVLKHVDDLREAVRHLETVSRGIIVISVPNPYYSPFIVNALFRRDIPHVNRAHLRSWDWSHFKTFIEVGCGLEVLDWFYDCVALPVLTRARLPLARAGALSFIENRLLRTAFPRFCRSITAVVKAEN
jgi:SAM-dependent methyltransferase